MRRLGRDLRQRQPNGAKTLNQKVAAIFRKLGTDAHVYLPGIGTINGLTAGNYLDSAGTTAATVDNPGGLVLDAANSVLGSDLVTNGIFTTDTVWVKGAGWTISGGSANFSNATGTSLSETIQSIAAGKLVKLEFTLNFISGPGMSVGLNVGGGIDTFGAFTTSGLKTAYVTTTVARSGLSITGIGGSVFSIDNISVKEVTGIHATQATTANKPILRSASGIYSWQFDGTDSLALGSVPFQMADDHCVIAGLRNDSGAATSKVAFSEYGAGTQAVAKLSFETATLTATWTDDAATAGTSPTGSAVTVGTTVIATARKVGNAKELRKNGVSINTSSTAAGATTITTAAIGWNGANNFVGAIYPMIAIKGTVTDADCLLLERFVGTLSGVQI